jgi:hypothetical protein
MDITKIETNNLRRGCIFREYYFAFAEVHLGNNFLDRIRCSSTQPSLVITYCDALPTVNRRDTERLERGSSGSKNCSYKQRLNEEKLRLSFNQSVRVT